MHMKYELGRCLLEERLQEARMPLEGLARDGSGWLTVSTIKE